MRALLCLLLLGSDARADGCVFDHVLVTLPVRSYRALESFFKEPTNQKKTGASWHGAADDMRGFLSFDDASYVEVWNQSKWDKYGYQDACRVSSKEVLNELAQGYRVTPQTYGRFAVAGRRGSVGDANGGMFFIWDPQRKIDAAKPGIRQILKSVVTTAELAEDYRKGRLKVEIEKQALKAVDAVGMTRIALANPQPGLIAVRFSRVGSERERLSIDQDVAVELTPRFGTLVLLPELYKVSRELLQQ